MTPEDAIPVAVEGRIKIPYRWPAGKIGTRFLAALRDERQILGLRCESCNFTHLPPIPVCTGCGRSMEEWVRVGPRGDLWGWTTRGRDLLGLVWVDGANTYMVHRILGAEASALSHGIRVEVVFAETRTGAITDILGFRPL